MPFVKSMLNGFHAPLHYPSNLERFPFIGLFPNYNESSILSKQVKSPCFPFCFWSSESADRHLTTCRVCECEAARTRLLLMLCSASSRVEVNQMSSSSTKTLGC